MEDILVWSPQLGPRLTYILEEALGRLLGWSWQLTTDPELFARWSGPKFGYAATPLPAPAPWVKAAGLLEEQGIREWPLTTVAGPGHPGLFPVGPGGLLPFDPLAACFFLLSRYEEYGPYEPDAHGRYPARLSWAWRAGCLDRPVVVLWARQLGAALRERFPQLPAPPADYQFCPTYDVDLPWAVARPSLRGLARAVLDGLMGRRALSRLRWRVWKGREADPFDRFAWLQQLHETTGHPATVFFLLSGGLNRYDVNPATWRPAYRRLVRAVTAWATVGVHPSYFAGERPARLRRECRRLLRLTGQPVQLSRQHFLRFSLPATYRHLIAAGLHADYSMGYAETPGFRAGTTEPFRWYDLEREAVTPLRVVPFAVMDVTLRQYQGLNPEAAAAYLRSLQEDCRREGWRLTTLWHNSSFSSYHGWEGWEEVYSVLFH
ncbi:MAG: polysaccharide deacetylase family protein [Lewinella sp.]|nr:polysaccharide deacetylase family protein [Lewinella sp.]